MRHALVASMGLVLLASVARAQHVEVSLFGGQYLPVPTSYEIGLHFECGYTTPEDPECPSTYRAGTLGGGAMFGARLTIPLRARHGVDVALQGTSLTHSVSSGPSESLQLFLLSVQPHYEIPLDRFFEAVVAAGMTLGFANVTADSVPDSETVAGWRSGLAFSGALRTRLPKTVQFEVHGTMNAYFLNPGGAHTFAFMWGVGIKVPSPSNE